MHPHHESARWRGVDACVGAAEHAFRYDTLGRLVAATDPDIGARS